jgi:hypothetical protein
MSGTEGELKRRFGHRHYYVELDVLGGHPERCDRRGQAWPTQRAVREEASRWTREALQVLQ